jgi:hypothetical protein
MRAFRGHPITSSNESLLEPINEQTTREDANKTAGISLNSLYFHS